MVNGSRQSRARRARLAALGVGACLAVSCEELPTGPAETPTMRLRGVTLADWTATGYASASAAEAVDDIARVGGNTVVLIRTAYQTSTRSSDIVVDPSRTPTLSSLAQAAARARSLGLRVVVKPHVDVDTGEWRGHIDPEDPQLLFASYAAFLFEAATLATDVGAEELVVGTELEGTIAHEARWRDLIRGARGAFGGGLVYAASWDGAGRIGFWDALDYVGVDFYGSVAQRDDAGRVEMLAGWQTWLDRLHRLHRQAGKPILLTEIGYRSVDGAGRDPFAFGGAEAIDVGEQADLYWAALEAVGDRDWIAGVYWWNWLADGSGGVANRDYTPKGKPAEGELGRAWN